MKLNYSVQKLGFALATMATLASCSKSADSFSILSDSKTFKQSTAYVAKPVDILWVIDNSGSMANSQTNLANSFQSFINRFQTLKYDFHMGVTTTDAYLADLYYHDPNFSKLRDGAGTSHSGVFVLDKNTPNLVSTFITNMSQGIGGYGDERAFSSFQQTLDNSLNSSFRRPGAFLAIIIVSDEDDFSHNGTTPTIQMTPITNYADPLLTPISSFVTYLNNLTGSTTAEKNYSVNIISILDASCLTQLANSAQRIGTRYIQLADATGGTKGSLCGNFGTTLDIISQNVLSLSTSFKLDREPVPSSIVVLVNGSAVAQNAQNGWTYDATAMSITFHGNGIPPADSDVTINFDPVSVVF